MEKKPSFVGDFEVRLFSAPWNKDSLGLTISFLTNERDG